MASDGGRNAARGLRYQYLCTLEALLDVAERDDGDVAAVHVEGLAGSDSRNAESVDFELAGDDGQIVAAVQVKARAPGYVMGAGEVFGALAALVQERDACRWIATPLAALIAGDIPGTPVMLGL